MKTMKSTNFLIGLIVLSFAISSCTKDEHRITPSANITSVYKDVNDFSSLDVSDAFNVYVTFSDAEEAMRIEANSNLHPYIQIKEQGGTLFISFDDHMNIRNGDAVLNVYVTARMINEFYASGATNIKLANELNTNTIDIVLTGASHFEGYMYADEITTTLYGVSGLSISGSSDSFQIDATGASFMEGFNFVTEKLEADLEGASNISLTVEQSLEVKASGASLVRYKGNGVVISQSLSGSSSITRVN